MILYLLNATSIWLVSLLVFDVFLKREKYHGYNRFYLLATLIMGILLPLFQWQGSLDPGMRMQQSVAEVATVKQSVVAASAPVATVTNIGLWIALCYAAGFLVASLLLVADIVKTVSLYRRGQKKRQDGWVIIETGTQMAPFSFRNLLFIGSKQMYSTDEWTMLLAHEQRHRDLYHVADLILLQLARILFWFHPLIYIFDRRLVMAQEYQADSSSAGHPEQYGKFLIEQAVFQAAPAITHSINRSPIKNRIVMLTRKSMAIAKVKTLLLIPVTFVCILCFSQIGFSQRFIRNGDFVTYKGNRFEFSKPSTDTFILLDPVTKEEMVKYVAHDPAPIKMNGIPIPREVDKPPYFKGAEKNLRTYLLKNMKDELSSLKDGQYTLNVSQVIVGTHGEIAYFSYADMRRNKTAEEMSADALKHPQNGPAAAGSPTVAVGGRQMSLHKNTNPQFYEDIDRNLQNDIYRKVCRLMDKAPAYIPAQSNGKNVVSAISDGYTFWNNFKVRDHKIYDLNKDGSYDEL